MGITLGMGPRSVREQRRHAPCDSQVDKRRKLRLGSIAGVLVAVDVLVFLWHKSDIARCWPWGDWPGVEWRINWPTLIFWICVLWLVLGTCFIFLWPPIQGLHARFPKVFAILSHLWTITLFVGGFVLLVLLPYRAIVADSLWFWIIVVAGLVVAFICSASELAFALACGERDEKSGEQSSVYKGNLEKLAYLEHILVFHRAEYREDQLAAYEEEAQKLVFLRTIGEAYASRHSPTLVVATNVANMLVAVVSTVAIAHVYSVDTFALPCSWLPLSQTSFWGWAIQQLPFRCTSLFGRAWLPFPVSIQVFQTALALTLILVIGEIFPKRLAMAFPRATTRRCYPMYRFIRVFGLGAGPSLGALGQISVALLKNRGVKDE